MLPMPMPVICKTTTVVKPCGPRLVFTNPLRGARGAVIVSRPACAGAARFS
jgi:hypothetical protein